MKKYIPSTQVFVLRIQAKGTVTERPFRSEAEALASAAGWRKAGARTSVERRVKNLPPLPSTHAFVRAQVAGPDAIW